MADKKLDIQQKPVRETRIRKLTFEQRQEIIARSLAGESSGQLSKEFGVVRSRIGKMLTDYKNGMLHLTPSPGRLAREAARAPKSPERRKRTGQIAVPVPERKAAMERIANGEAVATIAAEYGVSRAYIGMMYRKYKTGTLRTSGKSQRGASPAPVPTEKQMKQLHEIVRDHYPEKYGLLSVDDPEISDWTPRRLQALCEQLFNIRPAYYKPWVKQLIRGAQREAIESIGWEPSPVLDERRFTPEQLADTKFMEWVRSPVAQRIREREFDAWLREKNLRETRLSQEMREREAAGATGKPARAGGRKKAAAPAAETPAPPPVDPDFRREVEALEAEEARRLAAGQRAGKHAGNRTHPAAKKKKRRK